MAPAANADTSLSKIWTQVRTRETALADLITAKQLDKVHEAAFAVRDLVATMPAQSSTLSPASQSKLKSNVAFVVTLAGRLDAAGDAKDQAATEASFKQLQSVLTGIAGLYPAGTLEAGAGPHAQHNGPMGRGAHAMAPEDAGHMAEGSSSMSAAAAADGTTTVTGEIVDATCYLKKGAAGLGPEHRDCAIRCIKDGKPPFLRDEATGQLYLATLPSSTPAEKEQWLAQVGKRVRVTGTVRERDGLRLIEVEELTGEHQHGGAPHGGVIGMSGDHHLELVTDPTSKEIRIYVLDDFMKPVAVGDLQGTAVVKTKTKVERHSALVADAGHSFFRAAETTYQHGDDDITVTVNVGTEPLTMTLPFPEDNESGHAVPAPHHH
ncbi:MAG: hypothetical protein ABI080_17340 [Candidatus Binatia bacterium]